jgi:hypothetical protein
VVDRHPVAGDYVHWLVVDIVAGVTSLKEAASGAAMPAGSREVSPMSGPFHRRARTTTNSRCTRLTQTGWICPRRFHWTRSPKRWSPCPGHEARWEVHADQDEVIRSAKSGPPSGSAATVTPRHLKARLSIRRRFNDAVLEAVYIKERADSLRSSPLSSLARVRTRGLVELRGVEPLTSCLPSTRSTS